MSNRSVGALRQAALPNQKLTLKILLDWLLLDQLIYEDDARRVEAQARLHHGDLHPLIVLANQKLDSRKQPGTPLSLETLTAWLAERVGLQYVRLDPLKIDVASVSGLVSQAYANRYRILPVAIDANCVTVATAEPLLTDWVNDLRNALRRDIRRVVINPLDINRYLMEFHNLSRSLRGASQMEAQDRGILNFEQLLELGRGGELGADDKPVVQIVDWLLQYAFEQRASDIHLEPRRERGNVRFRIDGVLHQVYQMPPVVMGAVTSRVKILGRMDVAERRRPQDGRIKTRAPGGREVEMRLSTMPTAFGEKCVLRIFDPDTVIKSFQQLGFSSQEETSWREMVERPHGIILVTGPTGSGKTTTLYSTLKHLANPEVNICTVVDPIEMVSAEFNQTQVQPAIDLTFAQGIRTLLRQDPDIIMIGEVRDLETAQMAVQASLTGHLVLSTLHTNDSCSAITRLLDIGVPYYLIQSTLVGVVAQRLVRTLCPHCKVEAAQDEPLWRSLVNPWPLSVPAQVYAPKGCPECRQTGYLGRVGLYEMLSVTPMVRQLIRAEPNMTALRQQGQLDGMRPLRIAAAMQVQAGLTTVEEVLKAVPPNEE